MAGKKELVIEKHEHKPLYFVKFAGGGQLPAELQGSFTDLMTAQQWIDMYYAGAFDKKYPSQKKAEA